MWHEPRSCLFSTFLARDPEQLGRRLAQPRRRTPLHDLFLHYHDMLPDSDLVYPVHFLPPWEAPNRHQQPPTSFSVLLMQHVTHFRDSARDPSQNFHEFVANFNGAWYIRHYFAQLADVRREILLQNDALALAAWDLAVKPVFDAWRGIKHQLHRHRESIIEYLDAAAERLPDFPHTPPGYRTYWHHVPTQTFPYAALHVNLAAPGLNDRQVASLAQWLRRQPQATITDCAVPFPGCNDQPPHRLITAWDRDNATITLSQARENGYNGNEAGVP